MLAYSVFIESSSKLLVTRTSVKAKVLLDLKTSHIILTSLHVLAGSQLFVFLGFISNYGLEGRILVVLVTIPGHCLSSFTFDLPFTVCKFVFWSVNRRLYSEQFKLH